jgi:tRNA threonylcarbamoyladenosine biosynthesis protein TsaE
MSSVWLADREATARLGSALARHCPWGEAGARCLYLRGDLGAGKTTLAAALLAELGIIEPVVSPSYALMELYPVSAGLVVHLDLYRLATSAEIEQLGLRDYLNARTLLIVEWPERGAQHLPPADLTIQLQLQASGRRALLTATSAPGERWLAGVAQERGEPGQSGSS